MKMTALVLLALLAPVISAHAQLDLLTSWDGEGLGEQFGVAVSIAGDCNADGRADLAVGASANDEAGTNAGKVSIFYGRPVELAEPDVELFGTAGTLFGSALAWVGDTNGDDYDDLLVGAFRDTQAGFNAGKAFLFLGGDPMDSTPDLILVGPAANAYFGRAVGAAGDLNGDTLDDFVVGAPRTANGTAYVFFGASPPDGTPDLVIDGDAASDRFGSAIAGPGNVDGVAGDDLLVGAPRASVAHTWAGAIYLFSGGTGLDAAYDWRVLGEAGGDQFGTSVAAGGDINGDGDSDILAGAPYRNVLGTVDAGKAYLFYGGAALDMLPDYVIEGEDTEENMGRSVGGCGDVTGSGYGHFVAGGPGATQGMSAVGRFVLSPGGDPPTSGDHMVELGESQDDQFGFAVAGLAGREELTYMGDPGPDFAVGAWSHGDSGKTYAYGIGGEVGIPNEPAPAMALHLPAPNPTTGVTRISFVLRSAAGRVEVSIYDVSGRRVAVLHDGPAGRGSVVLEWNGLDDSGTRVASGVYFVRLKVDDASLAERLVVLR